MRTVVGIAAGFLFLSACFFAAFFLTAFLFRVLGYGPPAVVVQMVNSFLGLIIAGLISFWPRLRRIRQINSTGFRSIIRALERITKGDFDVRLDGVRSRSRVHPVNELIDGFNSMAEELRKIEKMRQEFISDVSHEIQSPLTSIHGFVDALRNDGLGSEEGLHYLDIIEAESERLSRLSDNLLQLSSLEAHITKFQPRFYRLDTQLRNVVLSCEPQWLDKGLDMELFLEEASIRADEDMLNQTWINLINNSIKFTSNGGTVRIYLHKQHDEIEVKVSDTGIGIAEKDQAHVFERFYKVDKSRERSNKGSGLGLSIAKRIVNMHHGTITVQSRSGAGTTFTVTLPP